MPPAARRVVLRRVVLEVFRSASRYAFQVAFSFAARPPVSTMLKPAITKPLHHHQHDDNSSGRPRGTRMTSMAASTPPAPKPAATSKKMASLASSSSVRRRSDASERTSVAPTK